MPAQVHMVCGLTGAGKTTYSEALRGDLGGVRFSIDDWNRRLFFMDRDPTSDFDWFYERVQRCAAQMREVAEQVIAARVPVVFDCGFTDRRERGIFYDWADSRGYTIRLHYLDVAKPVRWQRVAQRNAERGPTWALDVTPQMLEFMESLWQAPDAAEMAERDGRLIG